MAYGSESGTIRVCRRLEHPVEEGLCLMPSVVTDACDMAGAARKRVSQRDILISILPKQFKLLARRLQSSLCLGGDPWTRIHVALSTDYAGAKVRKLGIGL